MPDSDQRVPLDKAISEARMAMDLTSLSNERTLLVYIRTALGFFAAGAALIRFFVNPVFVAVGWIFIPLGIAFVIFGAFRFRHVQRVLREQWGLRSIEEGLPDDEQKRPSRETTPHA